MYDTNIEMSTKAPPYKPSWIDRFNKWVEQLPIHAGFFYALFGIFLTVIQILFLGLEDGLQNGELLPVIVFNGLLTPFALALIHFLDKQALTALNAMRPVLDTTESEFDQYEYMLSNMPSWLTLAAGLTMFVFATLMDQLGIEPTRYAALEQLPIFNVIYFVIDKSSAFLFGVFIYHTIRQLRIVSTIHANHIRVNLFNRGPLQAFSRLTASTAVGLIVGIYGWMLINPDLLADPTSIGFTVINTIMAFSVFIWPLYGVHRRMEMEKGRALHENEQRFEAVFSTFNQRFLDDASSEIERLNGTIASLMIQQDKISAIPTWPWRPETVRFVLTAIALPLVLTVLQFFIARALNW